jgi:hypothetical protein
MNTYLQGTNMVQILEKIHVIRPDYAKYQDSEFSDTEIEAFMSYFKVAKYGRLKTILATIQKRKW